MRTIKKGKEPNCLTKFRSSGTAKLPPSYVDYDITELRKRLVAEQGAICCYCMKRIVPEKGGMRVEHWKAQKRFPKLQLDYNNMLGACTGGEGERPKEQYCCDKKKENKDIAKNPANPAHKVEATIKYLGDGTIESIDKTFNKQLNDVLNLNLAFLKRNRKFTVEAFLATVRGRKGDFTKKQLHKWIAEWESADGGELREYCQVIVYYLKKKLARL